MKTIGLILDYYEPNNLPNGKLPFYGDLEFYSIRANYIDVLLKAMPKAIQYIIVMIPTIKGLEQAYSELIDGLIIIGNDKNIHPKYYNQSLDNTPGTIERIRTDFELALIKAMDKKKKAVLGICGGCQAINVAFGGCLIQDIAIPEKKERNHSLDPKMLAHSISIKKNTQLFKIIGTKTIKVNSMHQQAIRNPGQGLIVNSISSDGIVEGIEKDDHPFLMGVQWHPEFLLSSHDGKLFEAFVNAI